MHSVMAIDACQQQIAAQVDGAKEFLSCNYCTTNMCMYRYDV